jgi:hypothetical protein
MGALEALLFGTQVRKYLHLKWHWLVHGLQMNN